MRAGFQPDLLSLSLVQSERGIQRGLEPTLAPQPLLLLINEYIYLLLAALDFSWLRCAGATL